MNTKFFTNKDENTLISKFEGVFKHNPTINCFDAVVGYLRASGYFKLRHFFTGIPKVRILVGINVDKYISEAQRSGMLFLPDEQQTKTEFLSNIKNDIENAEYTNEIEDGMLQFIADIIEKKIEVRAHPSKRIHAKVYILYPDDFSEHTLNAAVITGSSNMTGNGLGIGNERQYEFNVLLNDNDDVTFAKGEFDILWKEAEGCTILPVDIAETRDKTYLAGDLTPYELYLKMLIEYFGDRISYDAENMCDMPDGIQKMEYQIDAVHEGYAKLLKYDGLFLADVVGLGKTVIATMIAKQFCLMNGARNTKILVVYPPALEKNWTMTFDRFGILGAKFISNGSLDKVLDPDNYNYWSPEEYDLILVDESHKFRNHETRMFKQLQEICKCPRINQGHITGYKKKVILISATPLNNSPEDIYNQILLFQDPRNCTLDGLTNLTGFFSPKIKEYQKLRAEKILNVERLKSLYGEIREKVIKPLTIRRTRRDIESIDRYKSDVGHFPKVQPPTKIEYYLDDDLSGLFDRTVDKLIGHKEGLKYARYQAIAALKPEIQSQYYDKAERVSKSLASIIKTLMVKRLESSFCAFKKSLGGFAKANLHMIEMFENDKVYIAPDLNIEEFYEKGLSDEEIEEHISEAFEKNDRNRIFKASDFVPEFVDELRKDQQILDELCREWQKQSKDPKVDIFLKRLDEEFFDPKINYGQKLVIFSESLDTVKYLEGRLNRKDVLVISSHNRNKLFEEISANFDENYEKPHKDDYRIILTTDALAEGVNLHRSNIIVHYDTPWNATRLMQRIGRVNRIGSKSEAVYNYVFYPSAQGNRQINLIKTSFAKIQAFHTALGEDNQIYSPDEIIDLNLDKLFDEGLPQEELNRELQYLEYIRKLKTDDPKEFKRIMSLPLRCRCGRNASSVDERELSNASVVFLKTGERDNFYLVTNDDTEELTSLEAMDIFCAEREEKKVQRIEQHHSHVNMAKHAFETESGTSLCKETPKAAGKQVNTAIKLIHNFMPLVEDTDSKELLFKLKKLVEWGTITNIANTLNKLSSQLEKRQKTRDDVLKVILEMAQKYSGYYVENQAQRKDEKTFIILSESFGKRQQEGNN